MTEETRCFWNYVCGSRSRQMVLSTHGLMFIPHSNSHRPERLEKEKTSCPHLDSNPTIQPVGSHYNIYAIPPLSHTEGDGINVAHRRGKYHENYTSWGFMWQWLHLCILISYDSCIYLLTKIHNALSKEYVHLNHIYRVSQEECEILREGVPYVKLYWYNPKHLCPKLNGYGENGQRSVDILHFRVLYVYSCVAHWP